MAIQTMDQHAAFALLAPSPQAEPATNAVLLELWERIVTGPISPGTRQRAEDLATELAVSRSPVRRA